MKLLVTGGCGYIGSHTIVDLQQAGHEIICVDNCCRSSPSTIDDIEAITGQRPSHANINLLDIQGLHTLFKANPEIEGIIHFAALKAVGESVSQPLEYYENNVLSLLNLLKCCVTYNVKHFVFSSSCTVYGQPSKMPVNESTPLAPAESPYAATKQMCEQILMDFVRRPGNLVHVCLLRYFNPAGAHPSAKLGENPSGPPQNLVPILLEAAAGKRPYLTIYGNDYPTRDGTCIRDYIHVCDIAAAHRLALLHSVSHAAPGVSLFNLGAGKGVSVLEAVRAFTAATGVHVPTVIAGRRTGDITAIYADNEYARLALGWELKYSLEDIMRSAWDYACRKK